MLIYELVSICSAVFSALLFGSFIGLLGTLLDSKKQLSDARYESIKQMQEFDEILKKASESNESLGKMCEALEIKFTVIDERVAMLGGTATQPGAGTWRNNQKPPQ